MQRLRLPYGLVALLAAVLLFQSAGCGGYPEVSPRTYEIAKALYSVCNRQQEEKLETVTGLIEESREEGKIAEREARWLREIVDTAAEGRWEAAAGDARRIMEDQIEW